jgi:hypothetical protein
MKHARTRLVLLCLLGSAVSCSQANQANHHLGAMDQTSQQMLEEIRKSEKVLVAATRHMENIAQALTALKDLGVDLVKMMQTTFARKPAAQTDDIDGVLNQPEDHAGDHSGDHTGGES